MQLPHWQNVQQTVCYSECTNMFMNCWFESCFRLGVFALNRVFVTVTRFYPRRKMMFSSSWENLLIAISSCILLSCIKSFPWNLETCSNLIYFLNTLLNSLQLKSSSSFDTLTTFVVLTISWPFPDSFLSWFSFVLLGSSIRANF